MNTFSQRFPQTMSLMKLKKNFIGSLGFSMTDGLVLPVKKKKKL
jgi:hypothetical protein